MKAEPQILYTEDDPSWAERTIPVLQGLGITVEHFLQNEVAITRVEGISRQLWNGALIDYHTYSSLAHGVNEVQGVQLIDLIIRNGVCGEALVLSSTADRGTLERELNALGHKGKVEVFDKYNEYAFAALFIAIRIFYPTIDINRIKLMQVFGIEFKSSGKPRDDDKVTDIGWHLAKSIKQGEFNLAQFVEQFTTPTELP
jgi:hypothetical protein